MAAFFSFEWFKTNVSQLMRPALASFAVHAEEEPELEDPMDLLREECKAKKCPEYLKKLEECNKRVSSRKKTTETCYEELVDLMHCTDHCVSKNLFKHLK